MKNVMRNNQGFSILEVIVVLAVIGALSAMLSPVVFRYIDDANRTRAQADVDQIATALNAMYKDTGRWAFYADGAGSGTGPTAWAAGDAEHLTSNDACDSADTDLVTCDLNLPTLTGAGWVSNTKTTSISNQLAENTPVYATTGSRRWLGPYLQTIPTFDPWNHSYLVNIKDADAATDAVYVVSAGQDGIVQTSANTVSAATLVASGDDIVARVK
jgi:prepilin-type N-terminal cleavage/methylation domain-containing protein